MEHVLRTVVSSDLNDHHLASFDHLIGHDIPSVVASYGHICTMIEDMKYHFDIVDVANEPPPVGTRDCYRLGLNFMHPVVGTLVVTTEDAQGQRAEIKRERMVIAHLPSMTGRTSLSGYDDCGEQFPMFIARGKGRTIPPTKTLKFNVPIFSRRSDTYKVQVRSSHEDKVYRSTSTIEFHTERLRSAIRCNLPFQNTPVPLRILVLGLGSTTEEFWAMVKTISADKYQDKTFRRYELSLFHGECADITDRDDAVMYISKLYGKSIMSTGTNVLQNEVLPHLRITSDQAAGRDSKVWFLAMCTSQLILYAHNLIDRPCRDSYQMARITSSSNHLGSLFRLLFMNHIRTCGKLLRRSIMKSGVDNMSMEKVYGESRLSNRLASAVASGIWSKMRRGVSINLNSNNADAVQSQLRRISSSLATTDGTHTVPRNVSPDQYGFICAASSPDGESTGLIYELGITSTITPPVEDVWPLVRLISTLCADLLVPLAEHDGGVDRYLYVDAHHRPSHFVADTDQFVQRVRSLRRDCSVSPYVSIHMDRAARVVRISCAGGMLARPLLIASQRHRLVAAESMSIHWLLAHGIIEYITPEEQSTLCRIATTLRDAHVATHVELTQASLFGMMASSVPFATGQQGPRLAYFTSQKKQIVTSDPSPDRGAISSTRLWHTHRPLVETLTNTFMSDQARFFRGTPVVIAFIAMPYNQEDALIIKQSSIDRGAFACSTSRTYISESTNPSSVSTDKFEKPDAQPIGKKSASYDYLQDNGRPKRGTKLPPGVVIIGKTRSAKRLKTHVATQNTGRVDISTVSKHDESGTVTRSEEYQLSNGKRVVVEIDTQRIPEVGDKFTSNFAQKGVVGQVMADVDMPFSESSGVAPDIVVSPLSMTSRMTMSSMLEALTGKAVAISGDRQVGIDRQHYDDLDGKRQHIRHLERILAEHGFAADGTERFIDGRTGEPMTASIFTGVVDYYRLVHIASRKLHSRSTGPRDALTRQPKDGRRFNGGLRIGEMESSAISAHGCTRILQERYRELSDAFEVFICNQCGIMVDDVNPDVEYAYCRKCFGMDVKSVLVPFTFVLMNLELMSCGVYVRFNLDTNDICT